MTKSSRVNDKGSCAIRAISVIWKFWELKIVDKVFKIIVLGILWIKRNILGCYIMCLWKVHDVMISSVDCKCYEAETCVHIVFQNCKSTTVVW